MKKIMTKKNHDKIVKIAEEEVEKFVEKWKESPYLWESEADVHSELYMRIKNALYSNGFHPKPMKYTWEEDGKKKEMAKSEMFNWIYCEPKTYIENCPEHPDIVIFQNLGKTYHMKARENMPMLWVCEIKYATEWSSSLPKENIKKDIKKLTRLLEQKKKKAKGADYVCYLVLYRCKKVQERYNKKRETSIWFQNQLDKVQGKRFKTYFDDFI